MCGSEIVEMEFMVKIPHILVRHVQSLATMRLCVNNKFDTFAIYLPPYCYSWYSLAVCLLGAKDRKESKALSTN